MSIVERTKEFLAQPFRSDMDAVGWFLFFGFLLAVSVMWGLIIKNLREVTE